MHTYEILLNPKAVNQFMMGRIGGVVYVLSGRPKREYAWVQDDDCDLTWMFEATEGQADEIRECLNEMYPKAFVGMRVVE